MGSSEDNSGQAPHVYHGTAPCQHADRATTPKGVGRLGYERNQAIAGHGSGQAAGERRGTSVSVDSELDMGPSKGHPGQLADTCQGTALRQHVDRGTTSKAVGFLNYEKNQAVTGHASGPEPAERRDASLAVTSHEDMQSSEHNPGQPPDVCTGAELHQRIDNESTPKDVVFVSSTEQNSLQVIADGNSMSSPCDPGRNTVANIKCGEAGQIMVANKVVNKYSGHQNNCGEAGQIVVANQVVNKYSGHQCECFTSLVDQTRSLLRKDEHLFVETQAFNKAVHSLTQNGLVLLTGPPGSGKSTTARGLLRHFERQDHFTPLILTTYQEWRQHVGDQNKVIILLDDLFGDFFFARKQFHKWSKVFSVMRNFVNDGKCLIVFTMYQHLVAEAQSFPVQDNLFKFIPHVDFHNITLLPSERMQMITTHLQHFSTGGEEIIAKILSVDSSGSVFPWCMKNILECCANGQTDRVSVVLQSALSFRSLLSRSLMNEQHGECLAAELLLEVVEVPEHRQVLKIMLERDAMSVRPCKEHHVWSLSKKLRQLINLAPRQQNIGQIIRMAAGVALASSEFHDLLLKVCDLSFLINVGADVAGFCGCVKLERMSSLYQLLHRSKNKDGSTPLHLAHQQRLQETANLLLGHGADPVAEDAIGITPLYTAVYPSHQSMILPLSSHGNRPSRNDYPDCPFSVIFLFGKASLASQNKMRHVAPWNEPVVSEDDRLPNMSGTTPEGIERSMRSGNGTDTSKDNRRPLRSSSDTATFQYEERATRRSWGGTARSEDQNRRIWSVASTPAYQKRRRSRRYALPAVTQTGCMLEVDMHTIGALIRSVATGCGHQKTSKVQNVWNNVQLWVGRHPVIVLTVYALFVVLMFHWFVHGH